MDVLLQAALAPEVVLLSRPRVAQALGASARSGMAMPGPVLAVCPPGEPAWAGVDEAGRGPLAGPVVAAACILPPGWAPEGLDDSKALSPGQREALAAVVVEKALDLWVAVGSHALIDRLNIFQAARRVMARAAVALRVPYGVLWVDGPFRLPVDRHPVQRAEAHADGRIAVVAAASVVAKVIRDAIMTRCDGLYPGWGFARHKGYATAAHREALARLGPSPIHRRSFAPVHLSAGRLPPASGHEGP